MCCLHLPSTSLGKNYFVYRFVANAQEIYCRRKLEVGIEKENILKSLDWISGTDAELS